MATAASPFPQFGHRVGAAGAQPVRLRLEAPSGPRNRLTTAFRIPLAIPHLILVGGPAFALASWWGGSEGGEWSLGFGVLGAAAAVGGVLSWFAILFTGRQPAGLWTLAAYFLRWRTRAVAYTALLTDRYPPFGEGPYPVELEIDGPPRDRDRLRVAFRIVLALPHLVVIWALGVAWAITTAIAWFAILLTGRYPTGLYGFGVGVLRWNLRVEAYLLLLHDGYPPFSLD